MMTIPQLEAGQVITIDDLHLLWPILSIEDRVEGFDALPRDEAENFYLSLSAQEQGELILNLPQGERKLWMRQLAPDDAADVLQEVGKENSPALMDLLDERTRREVSALLTYAEDNAGGLMSPRFARVRADSTVDEAIRYLRQQARNQLETIYYAYVIDRDRKLLGVVSFRELFAAPGNLLVCDIMSDDFVSVRDDMDQEEVARIMTRYDFMAVPVVDGEGRMKGIVTYDDIVDVVEEEATEDMQKVGGMEALESPYLQTSMISMIKKRAIWLCVLLVGEMLTTTAMARYQHEIAQAVVLTLFIPLIISSGGNSGSQATTLVIRAMALGELRLKDWWRVVGREVISGLALGTILALIGMLRIFLGQAVFGDLGEHYALLGITLGLSLICVVTWGTITGSALPFLLKFLHLDPASASAPPGGHHGRRFRTGHLFQSGHLDTPRHPALKTPGQAAFKRYSGQFALPPVTGGIAFLGAKGKRIIHGLSGCARITAARHSAPEYCRVSPIPAVWRPARYY